MPTPREKSSDRGICKRMEDGGFECIRNSILLTLILLTQLWVLLPLSPSATVLGDLDFSPDMQFLPWPFIDSSSVSKLFTSFPLWPCHTPGFVSCHLSSLCTMVYHLTLLWPSSLISLPHTLSSTPAVDTTNHVPTSTPGLLGKLPDPYHCSPCSCSINSVLVFKATTTTKISNSLLGPTLFP